MKIKSLFSISLSALLFFVAPRLNAQTTMEELMAHPEYTGGVHLNYPAPAGPVTKAPKGYKPFYVNHIARHGSRYLVWEPNYTQPLETLRKADSAGVLTPLGKDVLRRCEEVWEDAHDRIGELTPLGVQQHRGVAERMYKHYPEVFKKGSSIVARSTTVPRCMLSMMAFCDRLKEFDNTLVISQSASARDASSIAHVNKKYTDFKKEQKGIGQRQMAFRARHKHPERLMSTLFADKAYADTMVKDTLLMDNLFCIAFIQQDCPRPVELFDIFTKEELIDLWKCGSYGFYMNCGPDPLSEGMNRFSQVSLLRDFIQTADRAIEAGEVAVDLRFSHDSYVLPFTNTLMLSDSNGATSDPEEVFLKWCDFKACPMCANVQMIFYRNKAGHVIVKFLHNENEVGIPVKTDMYPFYDWEEVKAFYQKEYDYENAE